MENTFEFITEGGHKVVLKSFITFGEKRAINDAFNNAATYDGAGRRQQSSMSAQLNAGTDKAIDIVIVSIDGVTTDHVAEFMKLENRSGLQVIEKINAITDNEKKEPATPKI